MCIIAKYKYMNQTYKKINQVYYYMFLSSERNFI